MSATDRTLAEQAATVASGETDAEDLLEETLAVIESRNPELNAIVATFPERSREMLAAAPEGPLHGVPVAIKDEWPLPWRAETLGAAETLEPTAPGESGPYRALRDAGAVIVGVANMHEFGAGSTGAISAYGPARNPWDAEHCPGGSSSGPGSAVGGRMVAGAVGADGIGSIRYPAAYCGITGLKPTFGRSAMSGHHSYGRTTTIVSGPMCRDAADCRLLGGVLCGQELPAGDAAGLRIGVVEGPIAEDCTAPVREACADAVDALRDATGGTVVTVSIDGLEHAAMASVLIGQTEDLASVSPKRVMELGEDVSPIQRAMLKYRLLIPGSVLSRGPAIRIWLRRSMAAVFEEVDVIAWPTVPAVAPRLDDTSVELPSGRRPADAVNPRHCGLANLTGIPAISVPVGFDDGMPIGLQLQAAWGNDALLLDAAEALERATDRRHVDGVAPAAA